MKMLGLNTRSRYAGTYISRRKVRPSIVMFFAERYSKNNT